LILTTRRIRSAGWAATSQWRIRRKYPPIMIITWTLVFIMCDARLQSAQRFSHTICDDKGLTGTSKPTFVTEEIHPREGTLREVPISNISDRPGLFTSLRPPRVGRFVITGIRDRNSDTRTTVIKDDLGTSRKDLILGFRGALMRSADRVGREKSNSRSDLKKSCIRLSVHRSALLLV